jgi:hypothetical protein
MRPGKALLVVESVPLPRRWAMKIPCKFLQRVNPLPTDDTSDTKKNTTGDATSAPHAAT